MNSGCVNQNDLAASFALLFADLNDSEDSIARGLRLGTDDGKLLTDQCVQQRGLAGVGPAENADES